MRFAVDDDSLPLGVSVGIRGGEPGTAEVSVQRVGCVDVRFAEIGITQRVLRIFGMHRRYKVVTVSKRARQHAVNVGWGSDIRVLLSRFSVGCTRSAMCRRAPGSWPDGPLLPHRYRVRWRPTGNVAASVFEALLHSRRLAGRDRMKDPSNERRASHCRRHCCNCR